jgi:hypothetical protein
MKAKIKMTHLTAKQTWAHDSWYHQSNDNYLNAPHLPFAYYSCTVPLFDNLNVLEQGIWGDAQPGICLVLQANIREVENLFTSKW